MLTDEEIIDEASFVYFVGFLDLPEYTRKTLSVQVIRDIFKFMVIPCVQKAMDIDREE